MGYKLIFAYDNRGNLTDVTDQDNHNTHYVYDDDSRMTSVTNPFAETTGYEYSPGGRVDKRLLANGCVTNYGYDEAGRVNLVDNRAPGLSVISSFEYERDSRGNPTKITREDGSCIEYGYDDKSQLTSEVHKDPQGLTTEAWEWDYDLSGNRLYQIHNGVRTDYTYNLANQLLTETTGGVTTTYKYDRCGNTVKKQASEGTTSYRWDHENRLTQIDQPANVHSYFSYDADGKRVTKEDAEGFTRFIYQGPDMLRLQMERDEAGETRVRYTMGAGLEAMRRADGGDISAGDSSFYHFDWLGSTFELTDEGQAVTDEYLYNAWGEVLERTGSTENPHQWVGNHRYYVAGFSRLALLGHRMYLNSVGRFLTIDPIGRRHHYTYAADKPVMAIDATGLLTTDVYHLFVVGQADKEAAVGYLRSARDIWATLTASGATILNHPLQGPVDTEQCVLNDGIRRTVILDNWSGPAGWNDPRRVWDLQAKTVMAYVQERYGITPVPAGERPATQAVAVWLSGSAYHAAGTSPYGWSGSGWIWLFPKVLSRRGSVAGGIVAHEYGHGMYRLGHAWCGLMFGYAPSNRWRSTCLTCGAGRAPSTVDELRQLGITVPASHHCERHMARFYPGQPSDLCRTEPRSSGISLPRVDAGRVEFVHEGPCL